MNYKRIYNSIMERAIRERGLTRKEATEVTGYVERHRILPGCMGGRYTKDNIAYLTPEEHYVAHQLLLKIYPNNGRLIFAVNRMCSASESHQGDRKNKLYGWLRRKLSAEAKKRIGKKNGAFGSRWIHNGLLNKKILKDDMIPDGWEVGRQLRERIYNNCIECGSDTGSEKALHCINHQHDSIHLTESGRSKMGYKRKVPDSVIEEMVREYAGDIDKAMEACGYKPYTYGNSRNKFKHFASLVQR